MTQKSFEQFVGRLATCPDLRARFRTAKADRFAAFSAGGRELTAVEANALQRSGPLAGKR